MHNFKIMRLIISIFFVLCAINGFSQVGINTTTPSAASVIDIQSSNGTNFGGFLPPRVDLAERDLIPVTAADEGMLVYVINPPNSQLQIWDGTAWRTLFPQSVEFSAVLAGWEVLGVGGFGPNPFDATNTNASVTVGGLTRGIGLTISGGGSDDSWGADGWFVVGPVQTQAISIANDKYLTFTINPNFGVNVSLSAIQPYNIRRSATGPTTGIWQYSIDGTNFFDIGTSITWGVDTSGTGNPQTEIDLSGITDLQNLTSATTVTFRIVNWGASGAGGTWYFNNINGDDLIIRGNLN
tara:strand:+ start:31510 stop:32397 length:888 start_codon:yes stop_codon:yes gene_type:complete